MQHSNKYTYNMCSKNTDETLVIDLCNIRKQPLQHMQYHDILLQHPYETFAIYL
jgi:polyphosphate kinase